jgi:hypothetical protein
MSCSLLRPEDLSRCSSIGGQIVKEKSFFFGNYEGLRARESAVGDRVELTGF